MILTSLTSFFDDKSKMLYIVKILIKIYEGIYCTGNKYLRVNRK